MNNTVTKEQEEYFKNSKVRDTKNELIKFYHGSGTQIKAFNPKFTGQGNDQYGSGFYFTSDKNTAKAYTTARVKDATGLEISKLGGEDDPSIAEVYLNIENPIYCDGITELNLSHVRIPDNQVYDILKNLPSLYHSVTNEDDPNPLGDYLEEFWETEPQSPEEFEPLIKELSDSYLQNTNLEKLDILFGKYSTELRNAIHNTLGYDGVIINFKGSQHVVAWFPEQIKDVNNLYPQHTNIRNENMGFKEFLNSRYNNVSLENLVKDGSYSLRGDIALYEETPQDSLGILAKDQDPYVRSRVARNDNTSSTILADLAKDESWSVREEVAYNIRTPEESLMKLAMDPDWHVQVAVAKNIHSSSEVLSVLSTAPLKDDDLSGRKEYIRKMIMMNPNHIENMQDMKTNIIEHDLFDKEDMDLKKLLNGDEKFRYMMLSRLQADCDYYLGYGFRNNEKLWTHDEMTQIKAMRMLYNSFDPEERPVWITSEVIDSYEKCMIENTMTPISESTLSTNDDTQEQELDIEDYISEAAPGISI